jgi:hypothetical protein
MVDKRGIGKDMERICNDLVKLQSHDLPGGAEKIMKIFS